MLFGIYSARGVLDGWSGSGWHGGSSIKFRRAGSRALASYVGRRARISMAMGGYGLRAGVSVGGCESAKLYGNYSPVYGTNGWLGNGWSGWAAILSRRISGLGSASRLLIKHGIRFMLS